jgi:hypothetical protein
LLDVEAPTFSRQPTHRSLWRIDPLLGKDLEPNKETTAVTMQRHGKQASIAELLLETALRNPLLGSCNKLDCNNGNGGVFYSRSSEWFV